MPRPGNPKRQYQRPGHFEASGNVASPRFRNDLGRPAGAGLMQPPLKTPRSLDQAPGAAEDLGGGKRFRDSSLWGGQYWPYRVPLVFKALPAGTIQEFKAAYPARMQLVITVGTGIASFYYLPANPQVDQYHFQVAANPLPFTMLLPPGAHRMGILADSGQVLTASVLILGLPPEDWDVSAEFSP